MKYTAAILKKLGACDTTAFTTLFPKGAELTRANLLKAAAGGLDINWFSGKVLSDDKLSEYEKAIAPALADALGLK